MLAFGDEVERGDDDGVIEVVGDGDGEHEASLLGEGGGVDEDAVIEGLRPRVS